MTGDDIDIDEMTHDEIRAVVNTSAFQKALKYRRLAQGIEVLEENDAIYDQLVATITSRHSSVSTQSSVQEVLDLFVTEVNAYTEDLSTDTDGDDGLPDVLTADNGGDSR